jgi:hypothetical protein
VATHYRENAEGEGTAREAVAALDLKGHEATTAAKTEDSGEERKVKRGYPEKKIFLGILTAQKPRKSRPSGRGLNRERRTNDSDSVVRQRL